MRVAVLSIGTELTRGEIHNTNASWLSEQVTQLGVEVACGETIPDDVAVIVASLRRLGTDYDVILTTGGLGPTTDDLTAASVADCLGVPLVRDVASHEHIKALVERRGRALTASNAKQADFPAGANVLANSQGTAPGFQVRIGRADAYFMPGVPGEMKPMFTQHVLPQLAKIPSDCTSVLRLKTFGASESSINDSLAGIEQQHSVVIGYRVQFPEIEVKVLACRDNRAEADAAVLNSALVVRERLGNLVYGEDVDSLPRVVAQRLRALGRSLSLAESCTGGLLSDLLTAEPASDYFLGAVVCYSNTVKQSLLGVSAETLATHGAVSEATVREMARGAQLGLGSDYALAISGIAGPTGATADKPLGRVHIALAMPDQVLTEEFTFYGNRRQVQQRAAYTALNLLRLQLGPSA
jgi:nicotinamide-nucleotide amidase